MSVAAGGTTLAMQKLRTSPTPRMAVAQPGHDMARPPAERADLLGDPLPPGAIARIGTSRLRGRGPIDVVVFSRDGRRLAYGTAMSRFYVCAAADGKPLLECKPDPRDRARPVTELAFSPDGNVLAAGGYWSEAIRLFDIGTGKLQLTIPNTAKDQAHWGREWQGPGFAFTPDGGTLVVGGKDGGLHLWDVAKGTEAPMPRVTSEPVFSLTLTADGRTALTAHNGGELASLGRGQSQARAQAERGGALSPFHCDFAGW